MASHDDLVCVVIISRYDRYYIALYIVLFSGLIELKSMCEGTVLDFNGTVIDWLWEFCENSNKNVVIIIDLRR